MQASPLVAPFEVLSRQRRRFVSMLCLAEVQIHSSKTGFCRIVSTLIYAMARSGANACLVLSSRA